MPEVTSTYSDDERARLSRAAARSGRTVEQWQRDATIFLLPPRDASAPSVPVVIVKVDLKGSVTLSWGTSTDDGPGDDDSGVAGYTIYRGAPGFTPSADTVIDAVTVTTFTEVLTRPGSHAYRVTATDVAGNVSAPSAEVVVNIPAPPTVPQPPAFIRGTKTWDLTFAEEFDKPLDPARWSVLNDDNFGTGNLEHQLYLARNTSVRDGTLRLEAKKEDVKTAKKNPNSGQGLYHWSSAAIRSLARFGFGYYEMRSRSPHGNPFWPAWWFQSSGSPTYAELDIFEQYTIHPETMTGTLWYEGKDGANQHSAPVGYNLKTRSAVASAPNYPGVAILDAASLAATKDAPLTQWHTWGVLRTPAKVIWLVDGNPYREFEITTGIWHYDAGQRKLVKKLADLPAPKSLVSTLAQTQPMLINLAVGGNGPKNHGYTGKDGATYADGNLQYDKPAVLEVEYIRGWALPA